MTRTTLPFYIFISGFCLERIIYFPSKESAYMKSFVRKYHNANNNPITKKYSFVRKYSFVCKYDCVLFDMDNTLHNLYAARFSAVEAICAYKGVFADLLFLILNHDSPDLIPSSLKKYFEENELSGLSESLWLYDKLETASIRPVEFFIELIHELKRSGVKLAIISNADARSTNVRLTELGLEDTFDIVVNPETFGVKKPNPLVYQKTLECLHVNAKNAVMIGDKLDRDVLPARASGLSAIHVWFSSLDTKDARACLECPEDIIKFLQKKENYLD